MPRGMAALLCILLFLSVVTTIFILLGWQLSALAGDLSQIEERIAQFIDQAREYVQKTFGISPEEQKKIMDKQQSAGGSKLSGALTAAMGSITGVIVDTVLVVVYIFLFLYFRSHLRRFLLKLVSLADQPKTQTIINKASGVAQKYLTGLAFMIFSLWILYGIGFSIIGVKHAIFFAILCGLLEIIPFVGNITGTSLTIIATLAQGGDMHMVLAIVIVYAIVQFLQTYILEPLVVGSEVNINPLSTILVIVAGEALWGVPGMVLAIPVLGIVKIICDHIEPLKPYGYLIGEEEKKKGETGLKDKIKRLFKK
jgi:predicted PurR-regulated permease PerM